MADGGQPRASGSDSGTGAGARPAGSSGGRRRRRGGRGRSGQGQRTPPADPTQGVAGPSRSSGRAGSGGRATSGNRSKQKQGQNRSNANRSTNRSRGGGGRGPGPRREPEDRVGVVTQRTVVAQGAAPLVEDREVRANRNRARRISVAGALGPALVAGVVLGLAISIVAGVVGFAAVLVLVSVTLPRIATPVALRLLGARPLREDELPRLQNVVDGLCPTFGVRRPRLMAVDDELPNACSLGWRPDRAVLVLTTGLEAALDLIEMEGVIGHELSHLKRADAVVSSLAVTVLAPIIWLTGGDRLLHRALGHGRELRADQVAVTAVRYPPGLRDALRRFDDGPPARPGSVFASRQWSMSRWLWIDPSVGRRDAEEMGDLDLTSVRIAALAEL